MNVFFTDRDLGIQFPRILNEAGIHVERHADHFAADASDESWLVVVGKRRWFVLTHDQRIRYKPNELDAVMRARVGMFVLVGAVPTAVLAHNFVATIRRVDRFIERHSRPFIAKVRRPSSSSQMTAGSVEM